jgi:hypothetical protein
LVAGGGVASAQTNAALAEKLYLDGQVAMKANNFEEACAKFADSQRLDPALGTLMNLALCHEKQGKLATAWTEYVEGALEATKVGQADRAEFAKAHAAALEKSLQKVKIDAPPVAGLDVKLDGQPFPASALGAELPLDPGDHALDATAPGKKPWHLAKIAMDPSGAVTHVQVTLEDAASGSSVAPAADEAPSAAGGTKRIAGFVVGGVGVVAVAVGGGMLGLASSTYHRSNTEIATPGEGTTGQHDYSSAKTDEVVAYVVGAAGVVALGAAAYLVVSSLGHGPPPASARARIRFLPEIDPGHAGFVALGVF